MAKKIKLKLAEKDPFFKRESKRYSKPIYSREYLLSFLKSANSPLSYKKIVKSLKIDDPESLTALERRLNAMVRDGQLLKQGQCYTTFDPRELMIGEVLGCSERFGFLRTEQEEEDYYLSAYQMQALFPNDKVSAHVVGINRKGRKEVVVVEILERNTQKIVGRYLEEENIGIVIPDNKRIRHDIFIPKRHRKKVLSGDIVVVTIVEQPTLKTPAIGKITQVLGDPMQAGMEVDRILHHYELPHKWPKSVKQAVEGIADDIPDTVIQQRVDLRNLPFVTIDGDDAKDFDDAVYCKPTPKGWKLLVAIADVSYYVQPDSDLDNEALLRGTSVYFPQQVIPMLPEKLSNGLCSLKPNEDRLSMVCEMLINQQGQITRSKFVDAVICSKARLTYPQVAELFATDNTASFTEVEQQLLPHLQHLYQMFQALKQARVERGAISFERAETKIIFDAQGKITKIQPFFRNVAHEIIEECMIAANIATARHLLRHKILGLYRNHFGPNADKLESLHSFLAGMGLSLGGGKQPKPKDYATLLENIKNQANLHVAMIETVLLRSLSQAVYELENQGHFGLSLDYYTHFTSPIRRYPDLMVHRALRHLTQGKEAKDFPYSAKVLNKIADQSSMTERRAEEACRDVMVWLKCDYMLDHIGDSFNGVITGVTSFGLFVELEQILIEGLIHISSLVSDYYHYDSVRHRLEGEASGRVFQLSDSVRVRVVNVNVEEKKIDFELVDDNDNGFNHGKKRRKKGKRG